MGTAAHRNLEAEPASSVRRHEGGFHLHAKQAAFGLDEEVVRMTFSIRFCDGDAFAGGAVHESQFGEFTSNLVVLQSINAVLCQGSSPLR